MGGAMERPTFMCTHPASVPSHTLAHPSVSQAESKMSRVHMTPWLAVILLYAAVIAATVLPVAPFTPLIDIDKMPDPKGRLILTCI